jgi:exodeoxyribonuclease VII small subunit
MSRVSLKKPDKAPEEAPSFEKALKRLEDIVETLDEGNLPLARSIELFKEGTGLAKTCRVMLAQADVQIKEAFKDMTERDDDGDENL